MNHITFARLVKSYQFWSPICANQCISQMQMLTQRNSQMTGATSWNWINWKFTCGYTTKQPPFPIVPWTYFPLLNNHNGTMSWTPVHQLCNELLGAGQRQHGTKHQLPSGTRQLVAVLIQDRAVPFQGARPLMLPCLSLGRSAFTLGLTFCYWGFPVPFQPAHSPGKTSA